MGIKRGVLAALALLYLASPASGKDVEKANCQEITPSRLEESLQDGGYTKGEEPLVYSLLDILSEAENNSCYVLSGENAREVYKQRVIGIPAYESDGGEAIYRTWLPLEEFVKGVAEVKDHTIYMELYFTEDVRKLGFSFSKEVKMHLSLLREGNEYDCYFVKDKGNAKIGFFISLLSGISLEKMKVKPHHTKTKGSLYNAIHELEERGVLDF